MMNLTTETRSKSKGGLTVDWVVLTAAVVALAGAAYSSVNRDMGSLADSIQIEVGATDVRAASNVTDSY